MRSEKTCFGICLVVVSINVGLSQVNSSCRTPDSRPGRCVALRDCPFLYRLMIRVIEHPETEYRRDVNRFLSLSQCGEEEGQGPSHPLVCCLSVKDPPDVSNHPNLRLINHQNCGEHFPDKVHNGRVAGLLDYRWMVLLAYELYGGKISFRCGGTLISERYVLTAAHCVTDDKDLVFVRLGEYDTSEDEDCETEGDAEAYCLQQPLDISVQEKIRHPLYTKTYLGNDIALIRLNNSVDFKTSDSIHTICLPVGPDQTFPLDGMNMTVTGWGATEIAQSSSVLMEAFLPAVSNADCNAIYKSSYNYTIDETQVCAGGDETGQDSCNGDSGGPLKFKTRTNNKMVQYGIVSYGPRRCGTIPGVYTRVSHYMKWILDHMH